MNTSPHQVNLFYEWQLFCPQSLPSNWERHPLMANFEFVYFFLQKSPHPLLSAFDYPAEYFSFLSDLGFTTSPIIPWEKEKSFTATPWWGSTENLSLQQTLSSKLTSTQWALAEGFPFTHPKTRILYQAENLADHWLLKSPYLASGQGFFRPHNKKQIEQHLKQGPLIAEPFLNKSFDLCTMVDEFDQLFYHLNHNTYFSFQGGRLYGDQDELFSVHKISRFRHEEAMKKIVQYYRSIGLKGAFGIDSFYYTDEEGNLQPYFLGEVNARRTMGHFLQALRPLLEKKRWVDLRLGKEKKGLCLSPNLPTQNKSCYLLFSS